MMHCRLLIPDLFPPAPAFAGALSERRFPNLEVLIARGRRRTLPWHGAERWLLEAFSVAPQQDWPSAPFALLGEGRAPGEDFWAHAEPVHLRADRDRVLLADSSALDLSPGEQSALAAAIDAHFGAALRVEAIGPGRWYARIASPPAEATLPVSQLGQAVHTASASIAWHKLMNEIQMVLHAHPVNEAREARGAPPVNGLWLWGGGRLAEARDPGLRALLAASPLARGLASVAGVRRLAVPGRIDRWLEQADADGVHLFVIDDLGAAARSGDAARWSAALEKIEERILQPLVAALARGRIGMITLHLAGVERSLDAESVRSDLRHFWRPRRPLARYAAAIQPGA
jgi:hypothetical protein